MGINRILQTYCVIIIKDLMIEMNRNKNDNKVYIN